MTEYMQNLLKLQTLELAAKQGDKIDSTIADMRGKIPPPILAHYDRLRARGKKGLVPVVNQVCTACHMRLTHAVIMTLKHEQDIQLCDSCGRYLYLPDVPAVAGETPIVVAPVTIPRVRRKTQPARVRA